MIKRAKNKYNLKKKYSLIVSPLQKTNEPLKYLSCSSLDIEKKFNQKEIIDHPWENKSRYNKDIFYLFRYLKLIKILYQKIAIVFLLII